MEWVVVAIILGIPLFIVVTMALERDQRGKRDAERDALVKAIRQELNEVKEEILEEINLEARK